MLELVVPTRLPTYWEFRTYGIAKLIAARSEVERLVVRALEEKGLRLQPEVRVRNRKTQGVWRLPEDARLAYPVTMTAHVYRRAGEDRCDPHNFVTPLDKLVIDLLTEARGNKWRGLGMFPDDSPEWFHLAPIVLHKSAIAPALRLLFWCRKYPEALSQLLIDTYP
jgi:hypothetical protein